MCAINGIVGLDNIKGTKLLQKMSEVVNHRGPDAHSIWVRDNIALGHRLLKIQDLSNKSIQPMQFKHLILTYNGEIYNFKELRNDLIRVGYKFDTDGDTEVVLKAIFHWGLVKSLQKFNGCFAFGLYDTNKKRLTLVRDPFGIKPLYYFKSDKCFMFASEIKSILNTKYVRPILNKKALYQNLTFQLWNSNTETLFKSIYNLRPGSFLTVNSDGEINHEQYFDFDSAKEGVSLDVTINKTRDLLSNAIKLRTRAAVPITSFLSGGLDSSVICHYAKKHLPDFSAFTIKYEHDDGADLSHAKLLANFDKINLSITPVKVEDYTLDNIDLVTYHAEEVLMDKVYLADFLNFKKAHKDGFRVVLNGQGSDEAWLGYKFIWPICNISPDEFYGSEIDFFYNKSIFYEKLRVDGGRESFHKGTISEHLLNCFGKEENVDFQDNVTIFSINTILHNLLVQEDKLGMAHSIECRVPFVDKEVMKSALSVKSVDKIKDGREKYVIRKVAENLLPSKIIQRNKLPYPQAPSYYNRHFRDLCQKNWEKIIASKIVKSIIQEDYLNSVSNFSAEEQWWLLALWRFEVTFDLEVI